jgi:hypothetical protein
MRRVSLVIIFLFMNPIIFGDEAKKTPGKTAPKKQAGYLGVYMDAVKMTEKQGAIRLSTVVANSPARRAGVRAGDVLVGIEKGPFTVPQGEVLEHFRQLLKTKAPGDSLLLLIERFETESSMAFEGQKTRTVKQALLPDLNKLLASNPGQRLELKARRAKVRLQIKVVLGRRPEVKLTQLPKNSSLRPDLEKLTSPEQAIIDKARSLKRMDKAYKDVLDRFEEDEKNNDPFRLPTFRYLHRQPGKVSAMGRSLVNGLDQALKDLDVGAMIAEVAPIFSGSQWPEPRALPRLPAPRSGAGADGHLKYILRTMERAAYYRDKALTLLTSKERVFLLETAFPKMIARFNESIYLHTDEDSARWRDNQAGIELLKKIDRGTLLKATAELSPLCSQDYLRRLRRDLRACFAGREGQAVLHQSSSKFGPVRILGSGPNLERQRSGLVIDLGGHDMYAAPVASGYGDRFPVSVCLDLGGNDQYQSTRAGSQGSGLLGLGLLVDLAGDDTYLSSADGSQGCAFAGSGILFDISGDDDYRGQSLAQGAVFAVGYGALIDGGGDDTLSANMYSQGFAGPGGVAHCLQRGGDDRYLGGAGKPSSYGSKDVYQGFCQGAACGFRGYASGGIAVLLDSAGKDRYSAGNFSQGGGYYFGLGLLADLGSSDDRYVGSRYAQAFSAHSAGAFFIDKGGNDHYSGVIGALQGAAWDLSFAIFIDEAGNDSYWGMNAFSLGASAHNGMAFFFDYSGVDSYRNSQGLARAVPNNYHGGVSFSLFFDGGGERDHFFDMKVRGQAQMRSSHGLWVDAPKEGISAVALKSWLKKE